MDIQRLLKSYKITKAKIKIAHLEIEQLTDLLTKQLQHDESPVEIIEALSLKCGASNSGGSSGKISSPVESVALNYLIEWSADPPGRQEIRQRIIDIKSGVYGMELDCQLVESALTALTDREKYIIEQLYFEGLSWVKIMEYFEQEFEFREERTLKDYRHRALSKMDEVLRSPH